VGVRVLAGFFLLVVATLRLSATTLSFSGTFSADDDVVLIPLTIASDNHVLFQTTSFAFSKGFEPVLTLFDASGDLFLQDAQGGTMPAGCGVRSVDAVSGFCLDAVIDSFLIAGNYTLALSEFDNIPGGSNLSDGFPQTGSGNFTGPEFLGAPGSFVLFDGEQRTGEWALTTNISTTVAPIPEPNPFGLTCIGLLAVFLVSRRKSIPVPNLS